jgi:hypothetical protein
MTSAISEPSSEQWTDFELAISKANLAPIEFERPQYHLESAGWKGIIFTAGITDEQLVFLTDRINEGWRPGVT